MNEKMNGGISTMQGIFCRLPFQKRGGITAETIAAQGFDGGIFSVDTRQCEKTDPNIRVRLFGVRKVHDEEESKQPEKFLRVCCSGFR